MSTFKTEKKITVTARDGTSYKIMERLGGNDKFNYYGVVSDKYPEQSLILKIVIDKSLNALLDREAYILSELTEEAKRVEDEYMINHSGSETKLNYQMGFPKLIDNFVSNEQDDKRILILGLEISPVLSEIVPINLIVEIDKMRVDPKTSVWILGKLLKIIAFAHDRLKCTVGNLDAENIFIVKEFHLVSIFDWSKVLLHPEQVEKDLVVNELKNAVKSVILILGGNPEDGSIPDHEQLEGEGEKYRELLKTLLINDFESVYDAHHYFYEVVREIWGRKYHPYSTVPI
ncbi:MAG: hypothetical protein WCO35_02735 [Candidatus Nomurabacteria bacterium]